MSFYGNGGLRCPKDGAANPQTKETGGHISCGRCTRTFSSKVAYSQHIRASSAHNVCNDCEQGHQLDFENEEDLHEHWESVHLKCRDCFQICQSVLHLEQHSEEEHSCCRECGRYFENAKNLLQHKVSHAARSMACYGCTRNFRTASRKS